MFEAFGKLSKALGMTLIELMVVIGILSVIAYFGIPQYRKFVARARQAEAKSTLAEIHKLQSAHQIEEDKFVGWKKGAATQYGYGGTCNPPVTGTCKQIPTKTCNQTSATAKSGCTDTGCVWVADSGAQDIGLRLNGCGELRYGYWVITGTDSNTGQEYFLAVAHAPSDSGRRIYPTCSGKRTTSVTHKVAAGASALSDVPVTGSGGGDWHAVNEDKQFDHDDIIPTCEAL